VTKILSAAVAAVVIATGPVYAATIYGGPTYDASTGTGYTSPSLTFNPGGTAGNGSGVGSAQKQVAGTDLGTRAFRWDATGAPAIELGTLGTNASNVTQSRAVAISANGTTIGHASKYTDNTSRGLRAVRWDAGGTAATELDTLGTDANGSTSAEAYAVNASGTAVGYSQKFVDGTSQGQRAVRWNAGGTTAIELGTIGDPNNASSQAYAVSANGTVVGIGSTPNGVRAVRWDAGGTAATELETLGTSIYGLSTGFAVAVNDDGTTVGFGRKWVGTAFGTRAIRWDAAGTAATELGELGTGNPNPTFPSQAVDINNAGTAVGYANKYTDGSRIGTRAVRWDADTTTATELGGLGNVSDDSRANAINENGLAVGYTLKYDGATLVGRRAVLWELDGSAIDLNTLLSLSDAASWTLVEARGISDTNWVTGTGAFDPDGLGPTQAYTRAFLIQVPEPTGLAALAALAVPLARRRRR
jgi:hypothetical protein